MQNPIFFYLNKTEFKFPCSIKFIKQIPPQYEELSDLLIGQHKYNVQSCVRNEVFQKFLDFWQNKTIPELNENNIWEFYLLSNEFGIMVDYITSPQFEKFFDIAYLIYSKQESNNNNNHLHHNFDKTTIERRIATKLQEYLVSSPKYLFQIPLNSLYNIFSHPENNLQDHEMAYKLILKAAKNQNIEYFVLLNLLDGKKINSPEIRREAFMQRNQYLGFSPKNIVPDDVLEQQNKQNQNLKENIDKLTAEIQQAMIMNDQVINENKQLKKVNEQLITENQKIKDENQNLIYGFPSLQLSPEIKILRMIGNGSFGQVFLVENTITKKQYATKVSYMNLRISTKAIKSLAVIKNAAILQISNINHIKFFDKDHLVITTEYLKTGTLAQNFTFNDGTTKYIIILGIALGMQYLHLFKIVHGNLKLENVFLDENSHPLITDFGLSIFNNNDENPFIAPEILKEYDFKADVYSFAKIVFIIMQGIIPGKNVDLCTLKNKEIEILLRKCLSLTPSSRPSFYEIVETLTNDNIISFFKVDISKVIEYLELFRSTQELAQRIYIKILQKYRQGKMDLTIEPTKVSNPVINRFTIVLVGTTYAGKTTLLNTYLHSDKPALSAQINKGNIIIQTDHGEIDVKIIDPSSSRGYDPILFSFLHYANAVIFIINVNRYDELYELQGLIYVSKSSINTYTNLYLATSHVDLGWTISKEKIELFANKNNLGLFITSINDHESIDSMFKSIVNDSLTITTTKETAFDITTNKENANCTIQ